MSLFESFDFLYMPSSDVAADLAYYADVLGGEVVFAIEAFDVRVAEVVLVEGAPHLMLADHLEGEAPVLVHRVADLEATLVALREGGGEVEAEFEIPHGPAAAMRTPGGQRLAAYELTRPEVAARFPGRRDF
jgi:predicted enzyme related to lactoylglutathione lyase